ncbi:MAG: T9SS type A sorting domain-containing protein [Chitinophagaceae bacterium]|nr:MAG: T9SS type A sorting domain-containing protein [Chitinophagaceae bacterium]
MNTCYAVIRSFSGDAIKRLSARMVPALLGVCASALALTASAQTCPSATISYAQTTLCADGGSGAPMIDGSTGGSFSSSAGLSINPMSGKINVGASTPGMYTVAYNIAAAGSCPAVNATASVTVMERPVVTPMPNVAVCAGSTVNVGSFTSSMAGVTYMWTNDNPSIGLAASGTGDIPSFTAVNPTDEPRDAQISVYAMSTMNGVTCTSKPMRFTIFVNPTPSVDAVSSMTVCNGEAVPAMNFTGSTSADGVRFNWTIDNASIGLSMRQGYDMIPSFTAQNFTNVAQVATVTVTPVFIRGSKCAGTPETFTITVNPSTPGAATFSYDATPYCQSGTAIPTFAGPMGGTFSSTPGLVISPTTGNINTSLSTPGTYTVAYVYNGGPGTCNFINTTTITINASGVSFNYSQSGYCAGANGGMISPTLMGIQGGTFSGPAGLAIDPNTGMIDLSASTAGNYNVSYTVNTPNCGVVVVQTPLDIVETPVANPVRNRVVCAGSSTGAFSFSASDPGASFSWTNSNPAIGLPANGNGDIDPFVATNNTNAPIRASIRVVPRLIKNGVTCYGKAMVFSITVNPTFTVTPVPNQVYCASDAATTPVNFTNSSGSNTDVTYMWTNTSTSTGLALSGTGDIASFNPTEGASQVRVRATNSYRCTSNNMVFNYTVNNCGTTTGDTGGDDNTSRTRTALQVFESQVTAAPNPVSNSLKVNYSGSEGPLTLRLLDMYGQPLKVNRAFGSTGSIDMSSLRPGNYVLQLIDERRGLTVQRNIVKL